MKTDKLTKSFIDGIAKPEGKQRITYWDTDLKGFCLRVSQAHMIYYAVKRVAGRPLWVKVGEHGLITPDKARKDALNILSDLNKGVDINKKRAQDRVRGITLAKALEEYYASKKQLREGTKRTYTCLIERHLSDWLEKPLEDINKTDIAKRHIKIANSEDCGEATANNVMRTFRAIYNHAQAISDDTLPPNPVRVLGTSRQWFRIERRQTAIKASDLAKWHTGVMSLENSPVARDALLLLLFTGCREREILGLSWKEVDMHARTINIPGERTKNHRPHSLPMSDAVFDILNQRLALRENNWVFPGRVEGSRLKELKRAVESVTKRSGVNFCLHDLRRTFTSIAEQEVSYAVLKRLLNHYTGNDVTAGYLVIPVEQLRLPMQKVTDRIMRAVKEAHPQGKVVQLMRA